MYKLDVVVLTVRRFDICGMSLQYYRYSVSFSAMGKSSEQILHMDFWKRLNNGEYFGSKENDYLLWGENSYPAASHLIVDVLFPLISLLRMFYSVLNKSMFVWSSLVNISRLLCVIVYHSHSYSLFMSVISSDYFPGCFCGWPGRISKALVDWEHSGKDQHSPSVTD